MIRFSGLGGEHWCDDELSSIESLVGSPLYMDEQTLLKKGHQFARVCIMISAESRLVDSVKILRENGKEF